jgi:exopolysaccharide/PEP-CTERM locus tyrosine autokinase
MGKIFDALGKAGSPSNDTTSLPLKKKSAGNSGTLAKKAANVVPFSSSASTAIHDGFDQNLITFHSPNSVEAEIFKVLRTNLLFPSEGKPPKSILVTSALPGDGKSFVSANLAISLAMGVEDHVLLMDADIRNPSIDLMFRIGNVQGLSDYLTVGSNVAENLVKTAINKLTILPAGRPPHNPTELLTSQKMKTLLDEVKNRYDDRYIIVDSAPPALASETAAIAKYVDGILIVIKAGKTPKKEIDGIVEQLGQEKILGVVLNYSDQASKKYYGYGKSYYRTKINNKSSD